MNRISDISQKSKSETLFFGHRFLSIKMKIGCAWKQQSKNPRNVHFFNHLLPNQIFYVKT